MRGGFAAIVAAELVVVIGIIVAAAIVINAGAIGMQFMEWFNG